MLADGSIARKKLCREGGEMWVRVNCCIWLLLLCICLGCKTRKGHLNTWCTAAGLICFFSNDRRSWLRELLFLELFWWVIWVYLLGRNSDMGKTVEILGWRCHLHGLVTSSYWVVYLRRCRQLGSYTTGRENGVACTPLAVPIQQTYHALFQALCCPENSLPI